MTPLTHDFGFQTHSTLVLGDSIVNKIHVTYFNAIHFGPNRVHHRATQVYTIIVDTKRIKNTFFPHPASEMRNNSDQII